ncbi:hypothetical protein BKH46_01745 [Helicobacter sp. 12S02634-8]|uniref:AAA domain-containing protein n=1 Tax=Helicobacter sp. 12S02634-8 TaxID=1476199 RepID=UPI000BA4EF46|nr:AAA domain-containing protein [Helicobacter sp. 12S02634-8]PAF48058.1 hypothetical protein BKH46_01745 [Helicobacter sp. 12S02634-8]
MPKIAKMQQQNYTKRSPNGRKITQRLKVIAPKKVGLQEALIRSCKVYYQYLAQNELGLETIKILSLQLTPEELIINLGSRIYNTESLILVIKDEKYPIGEGELEQKSLDEKRGVLSLGISGKLYTKLVAAQAKDITLYSDLKFLITQVEEYFKGFDGKGLEDLQICDIQPTTSNNDGDDPSSACSKLGGKSRANMAKVLPIVTSHLEQRAHINAEQKQAIKSVFTHRFCYIWGPAGSGKTQVVLFECLLALVVSKQRACVIAPTNNALEQVLKTLIGQFDALGLGREKILRLGMPTSSFLESYPEVCEPHILKKEEKENTLGQAERFKEALVLGMTMDGFIRKYQGLGVEIAHIFLDECAFTPLIKACALWATGVGVSFLGDHKQLAPICEMGQDEISKGENGYANLWALSALHIQELLESPSLALSEPIYQKDVYAPAKLAPIIKLTQTHRYGDNLAQILDKHIYRNGLSGLGAQTELYYFDIKNGEVRGLVNTQEAKGVQKVSQMLWDSQYAVITPFVKQRLELIKLGIHKDRVWTIHSSQGQECDTVIFSPVCLHYHLTNSRNIRALHALNVAVSRIRKRLIIVCDYQYWQAQKGQFITSILEACRPFEGSKIVPI